MLVVTFAAVRSASLAPVLLVGELPSSSDCCSPGSPMPPVEEVRDLLARWIWCRQDFNTGEASNSGMGSPSSGICALLPTVGPSITASKAWHNTACLFRSCTA